MAIIVPKLEEDKLAEQALLLANRDKSLGESASPKVKDNSMAAA